MYVFAFGAVIVAEHVRFESDYDAGFEPQKLSSEPPLHDGRRATSLFIHVPVQEGSCGSFIPLLIV